MMRRALLAISLLILLPFVVQVYSIEDSYVECERVVNKWAESSAENVKTEDKLSLKDLLFFLHIPRTGGRAYYQCFLRKLYSLDKECPRSYDKIRFDLSKPNCNIVVSHDDYSLMSKLPKDITSVVTILRDPVERVFSMYEFAVEVAARFLVHPNLTSALTSKVKPKSSRMVSTLDIWPWKYLVPWMREDLFTRREARRLGKLKRSALSDVYNTEDVVMPLHEFISHPIAHEIIHNGAAFQVAGLTNSSYLDDAHEVRRCVRKHPSLGQFVLEVAKGRLDQMLFVGFTEDHKKSARMFASMVGLQVLSRSKSAPSDFQPQSTNQKNVGSSAQVVTDKAAEGTNQANSIGDKVFTATDTSSPKGNMTAEQLMRKYEQLMRKYEDCIENSHKVQKSRHAMSLKRISPVNFTKEARHLVPDSMLEEMKILNSLDMELYRHAQSIFLQQQILMEDHDKQTKILAENVPVEIDAPRNFLLLLVTLVPLVLFFIVVMFKRSCCIKYFYVAKMKKAG
ncbi:Protein-tyrosine sulfotransferase [Rhynchospora pubera]|uniref:Protein-tyrosine sulfotransferase n=2 Tax=Rhynchospora pubera TaxID=906938 RepID=A0AAV8D3V4_9POAL|nr:Protein-tyrosine sulfotransferase [Rhynchospora pubera]